MINQKSFEQILGHCMAASANFHIILCIILSVTLKFISQFGENLETKSRYCLFNDVINMVLSGGHV